jgi:hypothetical protein
MKPYGSAVHVNLQVAGDMHAAWAVAMSDESAAVTENGTLAQRGTLIWVVSLWIRDVLGLVFSRR